MQRRIQDWGWGLSRCFGRVVKTLHYGKVSPIVRATHHQHHSLSINRTYSNGITTANTSSYLSQRACAAGKLNALTVILHSRTPYGDRTNKLSEPTVPA
jgi:hypothetical protein